MTPPLDTGVGGDDQVDAAVQPDPGAMRAHLDRLFRGLVLLLDRCEVVGVNEHGADVVTNTDVRQCFYRRPLPRGTVSLWELAR